MCVIYPFFKPQTIIHLKINNQRKRKVITLTFACSHLDCSHCIGSSHVSEKSKIIQGYPNRSCGCAVLTTPAEWNESNMSCRSDCSPHFQWVPVNLRKHSAVVSSSACLLFNMMRIFVFVPTLCVSTLWAIVSVYIL